MKLRKKEDPSWEMSESLLTSLSSLNIKDSATKDLISTLTLWRRKFKKVCQACGGTKIEYKDVMNGKPFEHRCRWCDDDGMTDDDQRMAFARNCSYIIKKHSGMVTRKDKIGV